MGADPSPSAPTRAHHIAADPPPTAPTGADHIVANPIPTPTGADPTQTVLTVAGSGTADPIPIIAVPVAADQPTISDPIHPSKNAGTGAAGGDKVRSSTAQPEAAAAVEPLIVDPSIGPEHQVNDSK